jgi:hypothetical protein
VGLRALLLDRYRERFLGDAARASVPVVAGLALAAPSALVGLDRDERSGFLKEVLYAWAVLTAGGLVLLLATGWGPPYRVIQFAFFLPLAAAAGLAVLARRSRSRAAVAGLLAIAFVGASMVGWFRQAPAFAPDEVAAAARAGAVASSLPPGTPLVFLVDTGEPAAAYHVARAWNVIRMGVPAERIPDVRLAVGQPEDFLAGRPTLTGDREHDRVSEVYLGELRPLLDGAAVLVIRRFNTEGFEPALGSGVEVADGVVALSRGTEMDAAEDVEAPDGLGLLALSLLSMASLAILAALGLGWARWALPAAGVRAAALAAPSVGVAVAIVAAVGADRIGLPPGGAGAIGAAGLLGAAGYALAARDAR